MNLSCRLIGIFVLHPVVLSILVLVAAVIVLLLSAKPLARWVQRRELRSARSDLRVQRERLEAKFVEIASQTGKPRDLVWKSCEWLDETAWGRGVDTGLLTAFVSCTLQFDVAEGIDPEEFPLADQLRQGVALFHYRAGRWGTGGRVIFNMTPADAVERLQDQYIRVADD